MASHYVKVLSRKITYAHVELKPGHGDKYRARVHRTAGTSAYMRHPIDTRVHGNTLATESACLAQNKALPHGATANHRESERDRAMRGYCYGMPSVCPANLFRLLSVSAAAAPSFARFRAGCARRAAVSQPVAAICLSGHLNAGKTLLRQMQHIVRRAQRREMRGWVHFLLYSPRISAKYGI